MMITKALFASIILTTFVTALAYGLGDLWIGALMIVGMGSLWLLEQGDWGRTAPVALISFIGAAVTGLWLGLASGLLLLSVVLALSTWDLDHFARRLRGVDQVEKAHDLERRHVGRLIVVDTLGLILGGAALTLEIRLDFYTVLLLALLAVLGLSQGIRLLRREGS
ncbi:MAG: hypothetical protein ACQEQT_10275 [Chloroflexota bacterium]